ncbi:MAG: cyclic nucleotide-binding domain-containing protein, partial [Myxococcales bacterium]|nr:cyclic nucleotide-binding domain-containing protein [Myxococcales bacterium]
MDQAFLATIPYLRDLKESERASLMHCIAPVGVAPEGGILFDVGEASDGAYIVRAGELHVELPLPDGTHRVVARLGQGTLVGELSLIEHTPRTMRVRVMPGSQLYRIDRHRFTAMRQAG